MKKLLFFAMAALCASTLAVASNAHSESCISASVSDSNDWTYYTTVSKIHKGNITNSGQGNKGFEVQRNSDGDMRIFIMGNWRIVRTSNDSRYAYCADGWYFNL